jgi:transposase
MEMKPALALPEGLELVGCERSDEMLLVTMASTQRSPCCPLCGVAGKRVHSRYRRRVADLPWGGQPVRLLLQVRKYFCETPTCRRKIFVERLTPFVAPWAQVSQRLFQVVQVIGLATGGRLGVRVTDRLGIQTSRQTLLRRIMALPTASVRQVVELGIDDFSFRRGRSFGTILVNLQTRQVIDMLADRNAETAAAWMAAHPEIELVSRDRGTDYASAATTGAPQAVQCADRFHLLKNLGEAVEGCLVRHVAAKRKIQMQEPLEECAPLGQAKRTARRSPQVQRQQLAYREERLARYEQVVALRQRGMSHAAIAKRVGMGESTVSNWLAAGAYPETVRGPYTSRIDPYLPSLLERWDAGCHNMVRLHQELVARGYKGSYSAVRDHIIRRLPDGKKNGAKDHSLAPLPLPVLKTVYTRAGEELTDPQGGCKLRSTKFRSSGDQPCLGVRQC